MTELKVRRAAFRTTVVFRLGSGGGEGVLWNNRTLMPTLLTDQPVRELAARMGWVTEGWFYDERGAVALERC